MVPAGGLDKKGNWKKSKSKGSYLFNRGVMGLVFRARYVKLLRKAIAKGALPSVPDYLFKPSLQNNGSPMPNDPLRNYNTSSTKSGDTRTKSPLPITGL
jgi:hypothetical protein